MGVERVVQPSPLVRAGYPILLPILRTAHLLGGLLLAPLPRDHSTQEIGQSPPFEAAIKEGEARI